MERSDSSQYDQVRGLSWKFLSATAQTRDIREDRKSVLDDILRAVDMRNEKATFEDTIKNLENTLNASEVLTELRKSLAKQLSKALPNRVKQDDFTFVPGATADNDVLSDVRLQISKQGVAHELSEQSDGMRALYAIALYDLISVGINIVGIDEPEIHLHPSSQRSLARLLQAGNNQKVIATHSADIVGAFTPDSIVVVRPGGEVIQPKAELLVDDELKAVRLWVRNQLEPLTSRHIIIVEGISDRIILERLADLTDRNLDRLGVSVIVADGYPSIKPFVKLFGDEGFNIPMSILIDADAEDKVAKDLGIKVTDFKDKSVWVSQRDLEDEYVRVLGADAVLNALKTKRHFSKNELKSGLGDSPSGADVAAFCRKKRSGYKTRAALSVLSLFDKDNARKMSPIEGLLGKISGIDG